MDDYQDRISSVFDQLTELVNTLPQPENKHDEDLILYDDWSKVVVALAEQEKPWNSNDRSDYELLSLAELVFEEVRSIKLQLTALDLLCKHKKSEPLVSQKHAEKGLAIAQKQGWLKETQIFEGHLRADEAAIIHMYQNKFLVLSSYPLCMRANDSGSPLLKFDTRAVLLPKLVNSKKDLKVEFAIFTKNRFLELHRKKNGCRILILDLYKTRYATLYLEDEHVGLKPFTITDLDSLPKDLGDCFGSAVDTAIILNGEPDHLKPFLKYLSIKHLVYFSPKYLDRDSDDMNKQDENFDLLASYWLNELKKNFLSLFFEYLAGNVAKDDLSCLKLAQAECTDTTNHLIKDCKYYKCQINHWKTDSMLVEKDMVFKKETIVIEVMETNERPLACSFIEGVLEELSGEGWKKKEWPEEYLTRDQEVLQIYGYLKESISKRVNLWGPYGVGKTFIAKKLEYELSVRKTYPDGIFYFDLKQMDRVPSIRKQMSSTLGYEFLIDTSEFFRLRKDSLVILDGYDKVLSGGLQEPTSLLQALEANGVSVIFITEADEAGRIREIPDTESCKIERLADFQSLQLMLVAIAQRYQTFMTFSRDSLDKFAHSTMVRDCHGLPNVLLKNLKRIFSKGLGIKLESSHLLYSKPGSENSPHLHQAASWMIDDTFSDFEDDTHSQPSLYQSAGGPSSVISAKKQPQMSKAKSKLDSKKDSKHEKHKAKQKMKKEMR